MKFSMKGMFLSTTSRLKIGLLLVLCHSSPMKQNPISLGFTFPCKVGSCPAWPLLEKNIIGRRQNFGCPSGPSGQNGIAPLRDGERDDDGINTMCSHNLGMTLGTRWSLKKSNVKPLSSNVSSHTVTRSSWEDTRDALCPNRQSVVWQGLLHKSY
jgi:hypothetical protein